MLMNKRCTNSACRKTFSTLTYGGKCPFCGKVYPQLIRTRSLKNVVRAGKKYSVVARVDGSPLKIDLSVSIYWHRQGQKIKAIKAIRDEFMRKGYCPSVLHARMFYISMINFGKIPLTWKKIENYLYEMPEIIPVFRNREEKYRFYCCQEEGEKTLIICRGTGAEKYILTNKRVAIDDGISRASSWGLGLSLNGICEAGLFDASGKKTHSPEDCVNITVTGKNPYCEQKTMDLYRAAPGFTELAKYFLEKT